MIDALSLNSVVFLVWNGVLLIRDAVIEDMCDAYGLESWLPALRQ